MGLSKPLDNESIRFFRVVPLDGPKEHAGERRYRAYKHHLGGVVTGNLPMNVWWLRAHGVVVIVGHQGLEFGVVRQFLRIEAGRNVEEHVAALASTSWESAIADESPRSPSSRVNAGCGHDAVFGLFDVDP